MKNDQWLQWAQRLQAIAQNGLTYAKDPFDLERFSQIRQIAAEILSSSDDPQITGSVIDLFQKNFGYATPKVDVRAAVFDNDRILLVKERNDGAGPSRADGLTSVTRPASPPSAKSGKNPATKPKQKSWPPSTTTISTTIHPIPFTPINSSSSAHS